MHVHALATYGRYVTIEDLASPDLTMLGDMYAGMLACACPPIHAHA